MDLDAESLRQRSWEKVLVPIARDAGQVIMRIYERGEVEVEEKEDSSPITEADRRANDIILDGLRSGTPELPILSEESAEVAFAERRAWEALFVVDPLDGTKEFIKRLGEFTVNIALVVEGQPVAGVVYAPAIDTLYYGQLDQGARRSKAGGAFEPIATQPWPSDRAVRVVASRSHLNDETRAYLDDLPQHEIVQGGSSLKFCRVAEGSADLYPRLGPTMEWDTAAAHAVLAAAGGDVRQVDSQPLVYNKEDLLNPPFVAAGDRSYFER